MEPLSYFICTPSSEEIAVHVATLQEQITEIRKTGRSHILFVIPSKGFRKVICTLAERIKDIHPVIREEEVVSKKDFVIHKEWNTKTGIEKSEISFQKRISRILHANTNHFDAIIVCISELYPKSLIQETIQEIERRKIQSMTRNTNPQP